MNKHYEFLREVPRTQIKLFLYRRYLRNADKPELWGCDLLAFVGILQIGRKIMGDWALKPFDADKWARGKLVDQIESIKTQKGRMEKAIEQFNQELALLEKAGQQ
jgi:hypothetical protein